MTKCRIMDAAAIVKLLVRYNGIGKELTNDEREILLFALYNESNASNGMASQAEAECEAIAKRQRLVVPQPESR